MKNISASEITEYIKLQLEGFEAKLDLAETGMVIEAGDGIARVTGLANCMFNELLAFPDNVFGIALNLEEDYVGVIVLDNFTKVGQGQQVRRTGKILSVPVGDALLGRVVNALGIPVDGKGDIKASDHLPIERPAPGIIDREPVERPLQTGIKAIDSMIPIGRGQRELIIGDRQTGKTAIALDTIINQKENDVICIYVAIGQKQSSVSRFVETLKHFDAMDYTIVLQASASEPAPLLYISPYSGCTMGEYFMNRGKHVLVIYDDLSKHAVSYRQISLLLRRPPGREAYPGDVFYLHSRLLERAAKLADEYIIAKQGDDSSEQRGFDNKRYKMRDETEIEIAEAALKNAGTGYEIVHVPESGGSITALPVIETQAGDVSAYIPTNVISITDGQIFLETELFHSGIKPAINPGISVSRVGGAAQIKAFKKIAAPLRLELAQFRELEAFSQFGSDLDQATRRQLNRGRRIVEILKQNQYSPLSVPDQIAIIFAATHGHLDDVPLDQISSFESDLLDHLNQHNPEYFKKLETDQAFSEELETILNSAIENFVKTRETTKEEKTE